MTEESLTAPSRSTTNATNIENTPQNSEIEDKGVILQVTDSQLELFPVSPSTTNNVNMKEDCIESQETRKECF